jgi:hypothetical protein
VLAASLSEAREAEDAREEADRALSFNIWTASNNVVYIL